LMIFEYLFSPQNLNPHGSTLNLTSFTELLSEILNRSNQQIDAD
jgi:hypothetical protein